MGIWAAVMEEMMQSMGGSASAAKGIKLYHRGKADPLGGDALLLKLGLCYTCCEYEDCIITDDAFAAVKNSGQFSKMCTLPCVTSADGCEMHKPYSVLRYLCTTMKGKKGECLYPAAADTTIHWRIENCVELLSGDLSAKIAGMAKPGPMKDQNFINFIAKELPDLLECLEKMLTE